MANRLDRNYGALSLFRFALPSIFSLLFLSFYQMVDSIFIAKFIGENALAGMDIVYPVFSLIFAVTLMFSTGGSAVVAHKMGEGKSLEAKEDFTAIFLVAAAVSVAISVASLVWLEPLLWFLGSTPLLHNDCVGYLGTLLPFMPLSAMQALFSAFFIVAGKPGFGFTLTAFSGVTNLVLDYVFIVQLQMGIRGAAYGTAVGYAVAAVPGLLYFLLRRNGTLCFVRPRFRSAVFRRTCFNGASEMVANLSIAVTTVLFNKLSLHYMGEGGVAAVTVLLYAQFFLTAIFMGFTGGISPIFSFNLGSGNKRRLNKLFRISLRMVLLMSAVVLAVAYLLAEPIVSVYIRRESSLFALAYHGFLLFSAGYLFAGVNIFTSGLFTALHNGKISALASFSRTFGFLVLCLLLLPLLIGQDGIWLAVPVSEGLSCVVSVACLLRFRNRYYFSSAPWKGEKSTE